MGARFQQGMRWLTGIAVVLTLWWGWQLQHEIVVLRSLTHTATAVRQRITRLDTEITRVRRAERRPLAALAHATQTLHQVVRRLQQQELSVTLTCQDPTPVTLAELTLMARPCQLTMPATDLLAVIEVLRVLEQTQVVLVRLRLHRTEGMTMELQVIGPVEQTRSHRTIRREIP